MSVCVYKLKIPIPVGVINRQIQSISKHYKTILGFANWYIFLLSHKFLPLETLHMYNTFEGFLKVLQIITKMLSSSSKIDHPTCTIHHKWSFVSAISITNEMYSIAWSHGACSSYIGKSRRISKLKLSGVLRAGTGRPSGLSPWESSRGSTE